jgi:hypothetical protein
VLWGKGSFSMRIRDGEVGRLQRCSGEHRYGVWRVSEMLERTLPACFGAAEEVGAGEGF